MQIELILSFLLASVLLTFMPGPDNIFVLTESITKGQKNGIAISIGLCTGVLIHTLAAATGLSIVIQKSALAFSIIKYLGAAYLFYLAFMATKEKPMEVTLEKKSKEETFHLFPLIRKGFLMNVLNPKVSLFFIAFLPQFISQDGINITVQMIILGLIFMVQALVIFSLISILASRLTGYVNSAKFWKITKWSKVVVLSILGLTLALSGK
ncbi:MAG: threonine/homoserine/homoserine lactone efflux protein [Granulosicoccus sp.]|jgi:threonine/homoserine/homoserine lactone efflux protein